MAHVLRVSVFAAMVIVVCCVASTERYAMGCCVLLPAFTAPPATYNAQATPTLFATTTDCVSTAFLGMALVYATQVSVGQAANLAALGNHVRAQTTDCATPRSRVARATLAMLDSHVK
jgi:hypothetical protein